MVAMMTVTDLLDTLGRDAVRNRLSISASQISNAVSENSMPSSWYVAIRKMCVSVDIDCPDHLFTKMRRVADAKAEAQGDAA